MPWENADEGVTGRWEWTSAERLRGARGRHDWRMTMSGVAADAEVARDPGPRAKDSCFESPIVWATKHKLTRAEEKSKQTIA